MNISKSQYIRGLQCVKSLWLYKHKRDVLTPADAYQQTIFSTGSKVGELACKLFPGGMKIPFDGLSFEEKIDLTKKYINDGVETIYEATFVYHGVLVMVDILHKSSKGWEIFEVKSSTEVKDVYLQDASVQYYVLNGNGLDIHSVNIIYINNKYVRGTELEISKLFCFENVTDKVMELKENIPSHISHFEKTICSHSEPEIAIGKQCFNPYSCDCMSYCWAEVPEYSIFDISNIKKEKAFELYHSGTKLIDDIADIESFSIPQQVQILSEIRSSDIINNEAISSFLAELTYPLYNLDFETFQQAIPEFEGSSPFKQIPFQYSIHIENTDGTLEHLEFLAEEGKDLREALAMKLVEDIPKDVTVLAYNMGFEKPSYKE